MAYQDRDRTAEIDLYAATLSDPRHYAPERHVHWNERLPWVRLADGLPVRRTPRRLTPDSDFAPVLSLVREAFAFMEGRIDPPSSVARLTTASLAASAARGEIWVLEDPDAPEGPIACAVLTPHPDHLYLGKLAVAPAFRGQGLARQLVGHAAGRAKALGLAELRLETRVELTENHAAFRAMGFSETGRSAHAGYDRPTSITFTLRP
ncbi:MAG: GNAT family N-acetyltransferase [Proteobacteria bacterium]|nr:GNAT family N-acetyltransferase [Pseudomonadota bacterium]MBS0572960.1 GNAT family N-acetyltransferase [Pseudomonadota bacterium]